MNQRKAAYVMQLIPYRDVILVKKSKSFWGAVVKFFLKSEYLHSEYVVDDWLTFGTDLSRPANIHTFGYRRADIDVFRYYKDITESQKRIIVEELQKSTALRYDWQEALFLGLGLKYRGNDLRYNCISLILQAMEKAGLLPKNIYKTYRDFKVFTESQYFIKVQ